MTPREQLWERLAFDGIVQGAPPADAGDASPWYVRAMLGIAAWLAAVFLLLFVGIGLSDLLRNATAAIVVGAVICGAAVTLLRMTRGSVFVVQLAVAASLAGQGLFAFGVLEHGWRDLAPWLGVAAFELVLIVLAPDYLHRVLSTLAAAFAVRMAAEVLGWNALFPALLASALVAVHGADLRSPPRAALVAPVTTGLVLALLLVIPVALLWGDFFAARRAVLFTGVAPWLGPAALGIVFVAGVAKLLAEANVAWTSLGGIGALLAALAVAALAWPVPGVVIALLVLLLAFAASQRVLMGMALLALLFALGHYYYSLQFTLLVKAGALSATGVVLVGARFLVRMALPRETEAGHA